MLWFSNLLLFLCIAGSWSICWMLTSSVSVIVEIWIFELSRVTWCLCYWPLFDSNSLPYQKCHWSISNNHITFYVLTGLLWNNIHKHFRTIRVSIVHMFTWPTFLTNVFFNLHCFAKWYILPHCLQLCPHAGHCCLDFTCRLPQYLQLISGIRLTDLAFSFIRGILPLLTVSARYILPFSIAFSTDLQISIIFFRVSACSRDKICCVVVSLISRTILSRINELT